MPCTRGRSQASMHCLWNSCLQGKVRICSSRSNEARQIEHSKSCITSSSSRTTRVGSLSIEALIVESCTDSRREATACLSLALQCEMQKMSVAMSIQVPPTRNRPSLSDEVDDRNGGGGGADGMRERVLFCAGRSRSAITMQQFTGWLCARGSSAMDGADTQTRKSLSRFPAGGPDRPCTFSPAQSPA
jgi:hypothetical protein